MARELDSEEDYRERSVLGWVLLLRSEVVPADQRPEALAEAIAAFLPCFLAGEGALPPDLSPRLAAAAIEPAIRLLEAAVEAPSPASCRAAVQAWRSIVVNGLEVRF